MPYPPINSVSFIGLGAMGYLMAAHLVNKFDDVRVYNRTSSVAQAHATDHGTHAVCLADALDADIIISCLPTSEVVSQIIQSNLGVLKKIDRAQVWVDCTSGTPVSAQTLTKTLSGCNVAFLDAPVSGQTSGAKAGTLTVMVGGNADALTHATPVIDCFAGQITHVGNAGTGFAVKAVNNTLLAANLWAAAEGLSILKSHGVDLSGALKCINASSGQSMATTHVLPERVLNRTFPNTFAINLLAKDCGIAAELQAQAKLPTPLLAQIVSLCQAASNQHTEGEADFSVMVKLLESMRGIELS